MSSTALIHDDTFDAAMDAALADGREPWQCATSAHTAAFKVANQRYLELGLKDELANWAAQSYAAEARVLAAAVTGGWLTLEQAKEVQKAQHPSC
jgi:hypothetical protein